MPYNNVNTNKKGGKNMGNCVSSSAIILVLFILLIIILGAYI